MIKDSCHSEYQDWIAIAEHPLKQRVTPHIMKGIHTAVRSLELASRHPLLEEQKQCHNARNEIDDEDIARKVLRIVEPAYPRRMRLIDQWTYDENEEIESYVHQDIQHLEASKFLGLLLIAKIDKRDTGKSVDCHNDCHNGNILWMFGIPEPRRQLTEKCKHNRKEAQRQATYRDESRRIDMHGILVLLVCKAEECSLHAKSKKDENESRKGIEIGDDAIFT